MAKKALQAATGDDGAVGVSVTGILLLCTLCAACAAGIVGLFIMLARKSLLKKYGGNRVLAKHGSLIF